MCYNIQIMSERFIVTQNLCIDDDSTRVAQASTKKITERKRGRPNTSWKDICQIDHGEGERTTEHKLERRVPNRSWRGGEDDRTQAGKTCAK